MWKLVWNLPKSSPETDEMSFTLTIGIKNFLTPASKEIGIEIKAIIRLLLFYSTICVKFPKVGGFSGTCDKSLVSM